MPVLPKDIVRSHRREVYRRADALGVTLESERQLYGANTRALVTAAVKAINDAIPAARPDMFVVDAPPAGVFNGSNTTFTLSDSVDGLQLSVVFTDVSAMSGGPLRRTDVNPPAAGEFFFDPNTPNTIITGDAPAADDMLTVSFKKK